MELKITQAHTKWIAALCASLLLCSCEFKARVAQSGEDDTGLIVPIRRNSSITGTLPLADSLPSLQSGTSRSTTHSSRRLKRRRDLASLNGHKSSSQSDTHLISVGPILNANYKIAGIGRAQDPSTIHNWNWTRDFGGTVDAVTISF